MRRLPQVAPAADGALRNKKTSKPNLQIQLSSPKADQFSSDNIAWAEGDFGVTTGRGKLVCCGGPAPRPGARDLREQTEKHFFIFYVILFYLVNQV